MKMKARRETTFIEKEVLTRKERAKKAAKISLGWAPCEEYVIKPPNPTACLKKDIPKTTFIEKEVLTRKERAKKAAKISLGWAPYEEYVIKPTNPKYMMPQNIHRSYIPENPWYQTVFIAFHVGIALFIAGFFLCGFISMCSDICSYDPWDEGTYKTHWEQAGECYEKGDMEGAAYHIEKSPDDGSYPYENY
jgi:Ca2+-dependent lipid-binding protein